MNQKEICPYFFGPNQKFLLSPFFSSPVCVGFSFFAVCFDFLFFGRQKRKQENQLKEFFGAQSTGATIDAIKRVSIFRNISKVFANVCAAAPCFSAAWRRFLLRAIINFFLEVWQKGGKSLSFFLLNEKLKFGVLIVHRLFKITLCWRSYWLFSSAFLPPVMRWDVEM